MLKYKQQTVATQGFTLVELSIVVIIIGFLIAGIAAGTSLIKQAEINSVVTDFQAYQTAYNNFLNRYSQAPGDFSAAEVALPSCTGTLGSCDGNGNGVIDSTAESLSAWRELSVAGMISAGIADPDGVTALSVGVNVPTSKVSTAGYMMIQGDDTVISSLTTDTTALWDDARTNAVFVGVPSGLLIDHGGLIAQDAFNIDRKLDDGNITAGTFNGAQSGAVRVFEDPAAATANQCLTNGNEAKATGANTYNVGASLASCVVGIALN